MSQMLLKVLYLCLLCQIPFGRSDDEEEDSSEHGVVTTRRHNNCTCGTANKGVTKIVNGTATKQHEYPMMAGLVHLAKDIVQCGGTIITPRHISTAAHCLQPFRINQYAVFVGHHNYQQVKENYKLYKPERAYIHEQYNAGTYAYDIGIVFIEGKLELSTTVVPACLFDSRVDLTGEKVTIMGWGGIRYNGPQPDTLLKIKVDVISRKQCENDETTELALHDPHQICTKTKNKDACTGDSGGPVLYLDADTNRYTLVGSVSYGLGCAKYSAVHIDMGYFLPWIQHVISKSDSSMQTCAKI